MKIIIASIFLQIILGTSYAQDIYERAAKQASEGGNRLFYTEHLLATSEAFAYLHNDYTPKAYNKIVYFVNTEDTRTLNIIQKELTEAGFNVVDFFKMGCTVCNDPASMKAFLKSQGVDCILQITLSSERVKGTSVTTNFYQFFGVMTATSQLETWLDVFTVFEWYNDDFEDIPFLKSEVLKTSGRKYGKKGLFYGLLEGNVVILSRRPIKKDLLIPKK